MQFSTPTARFIQALDTASSALTGKQSLPALTCALVEISKDGYVSVTCDSLDARVSVQFDGATASEPFSFLASPRLLKAAMRGDDALLELNEGRLHIKSAGDSRLLTVPVSEFPKPWATMDVHPVNAPSLFTALKMASNCANSAAGNDMIYWDKDLKMMFGKDAKALCACPVDLGFSESFILPASQAKVITSCFDVDDSFSAGLQNNKLHFSEGNVRAWVNLIEGKVLNIKPLILDSPVLSVIGREALESALNSLSAFLDDQFQKTQITPHGVEWIISSRSLAGESSVTMSGVEDMNLEAFACSGSGLLSIIKHWTCDRISIRQNPNCVMLTPDDGSGCIGIAPQIRSA